MELEQLIDEAKNGDQAAFGAIVSRFQDMAAGYAFSILRDSQLAQDAAQEAFIDAYFKLNQLSANAAFPGWFRTILFKHCDRMSRKKKVVHVPIDSLQPVDNRTPAEAVAENELKTTIFRALESLSMNEWQVVALFYFADQPQKQIADFLDISIDSVKNCLRTARRKMKEELMGLADDYMMPRRPSRSNDFLISVGERLNHFDLSPECDAELTENGLVIRKHEGWSAKTYTTPISIRTQVKTKGINHVRLFFGPSGALHVHWQDGGIEFRDPVTGYPFRKDLLPSSIGEWLDVAWLITEDRIKLYVDGEEVFHGTGNYRGLSSKVGIGTNNVSRHPLTVKSLQVVELHAAPNHQGRLSEYVQPNRGIVHDRLSTAGFNVSQLGCMKGCADFLGISVSNEWLFGITGQAFLLTVDRGIGGIGQDRSFLISEKIRKLAGNAGIKVHCLAGPANTDIVGHAWDQIRSALEKGKPCYAWEIELLGEYGIIYGFNKDGYLVKGWHGAHGPIDWRSIGTTDTNGNTLSGHLELCLVEQGEKIDDLAAIREGIDFALEQLRHSNEMSAQGLVTGVEAYDEWIRSLLAGEATGFGTCYHASVWRECRYLAVKFLLNEVVHRLNDLDAKEEAYQAAKHYRKVYEQLDMIYSELFPWPQPREAIKDKQAIHDAVQCLTHAREAEQLAIQSLKLLSNKLR